MAAEPTSREPNFFELLKAGILSGSLGKHPGVATPGPFIASAVWGEGSRKVEGPLGADFESYSNVSDFQLIQIGANIIDQSDTDNYPTAIYLNFTPPRSYPEGELFQTAFGTENLPYLARMGLLNAITKDAGAVGGNQTNSSWIQPELWNPHQDPGGYPSASTPTQLRLVTFGECFTGNADVVLPNAANPKNPGDPVVFGDDPSTPSDQGRIDFTNSSVFFNNPVPLTSIATGGSASSPTTKNQWPTTASGCLIDFSSINPFVAVWTGDVERIKPAAPTSNRIRIVPDLNLTFLLQYNDGAGWRPYSLMARIQTMGTQSWASANSNGNPGWKEFAGRPDPRTDRFSAAQGETQGGNSPMLWPFKSTIRWDSAATAYGAVGAGYPLPGAGFTYSPLPVSPPNYAQSLYINLWAQNQSSATNPNGSKAYYPDPDDVIRPGDAFRANYTTGDGIMLYHLISPAGVSSSAATGRRPVILNHPFRSVGELGYAFRDLPFKTLDFWSDVSADAGLLDLFSVNDGPGIVAGQINPNNAPVPVLQAAIAGTMKNEASGLAFGSADAQTMAAQIASQISSVPLLSRADLVPAISSAIAVKLGAIPDLANKAYGEVSVRALAPATSTRTWNLLIDVVAQAGRMSPNAAGLNDFIVEGERRYWLHVAIDRYTGKIVDQQLEPVYE